MPPVDYSNLKIQNHRKYLNSKSFFLERFSQHCKYLELTAITRYTLCCLGPFAVEHANTLLSYLIF